MGFRCEQGSRRITMLAVSRCPVSATMQAALSFNLVVVSGMTGPVRHRSCSDLQPLQQRSIQYRACTRVPAVEGMTATKICCDLPISRLVQESRCQSDKTVRFAPCTSEAQPCRHSLGRRKNCPCLCRCSGPLVCKTASMTGPCETSRPMVWCRSVPVQRWRRVARHRPWQGPS
jgi:hypothetical protein